MSLGLKFWANKYRVTGIQCRYVWPLKGENRVNVNKYLLGGRERKGVVLEYICVLKGKLYTLTIKWMASDSFKIQCDAIDSLLVTTHRLREIVS